MSFIPEDRLGMGLVANMDMVDNVILKDYKRQKGLLLSRKPARKTALKMVEDLDIVTQGVQYPIRLLSGGNVQKVLLGREINSSPQLLITAYPVRGLDINSSYVIYDMLNEQKKKGVAVLYIGEDLNVLLELCDRIMVICGGRIMGMVEPKDVTIEDLGLMMTGHTYPRYLLKGGLENDTLHIVKRPYMKTYQQVIVRLLVLTAFTTSILMLLKKILARFLWHCMSL